MGGGGGSVTGGGTGGGSTGGGTGGGTANPCAGITCTALDQCHSIGTCTAGVCSNPLKAAGSTCNDGNLCTLSDTCNASGACVGGTAMTCPAPSGVCQVAICNPSTGVCGSTAAPRDTVCGTQPSQGLCRVNSVSGLTECVTGVIGANCSPTSTLGLRCTEGTCNTSNRCVACGAVGQPCCAYSNFDNQATATHCLVSGVPWLQSCCVSASTCSAVGNSGVCQ